MSVFLGGVLVVVEGDRTGQLNVNEDVGGVMLILVTVMLEWFLMFVAGVELWPGVVRGG